MNRWRVGNDRGSKETDRCPLTITKVPSPSPLITSFTHSRNISTYDITMSDPWYGADYLTYSIVPQRIILPIYLPRRYQGRDSQY
jgi:hypothetical protein